MEIKTIVIAEGFDYDDELFIPACSYEFIEEGPNGYEMIKVNGEWLDLVDFYSIAWVNIY